MEITEPVILDLAQGRKRVRLELTTRADARDLMKAVERCMERLPDDGEGLLALVEVQELPDVTEAEPHDDGTSYCTSLPEHDHDTVSAEAVAALADSIAGGTPVVVANPPHHAGVGEAMCEGEVGGDGYICSSQADHDGPDHVAYGIWSEECHRWPVDGGEDGELSAATLYDHDEADEDGPMDDEAELRRAEEIRTAAEEKAPRTVTLALVPGAARSDSDVLPELQKPCPEAHPTNGTLCEGKIPHPMPHRDPNGDEWSTEPLAGAL
jgi:hypothetical protein